MKTQMTMALMTMVFLPLTACQKSPTQPSFKVKGADLQQHPVAFRMGRPWILTKKVCLKSGRDLTKVDSIGVKLDSTAAKLDSIEGSTQTITIDETLNFNRTTVVGSSIVSSNSKTGTSASNLSATGSTTMNYVLRLDDKNNFILESTVLALNDQDLKNKFGLSSTAKIGDKSESNYVATEQSLRLTRASNQECEDSTDQVVSTYK